MQFQETPQAHLSDRLTDGTLVLGVGNILQADDGLGVRIAEMLSAKNLPPDVSVQDAGTPGLGLISIMEGWKKVILVDAVNMGKIPGTWRRFGVEDVVMLSSEAEYSLHESGISSALELAHAAKLLPEDVVIFGVQPELIEWSDKLSPSVIAVLPDVVDQIHAEIWKREE